MGENVKLQQLLLSFLKRRHTGSDMAIQSLDLEIRFCVTGPQLRRAVLCLRRDGHPICSDQNGYYYAANPSELWETIVRLERRTVTTTRVCKGLRASSYKFPDNGQVWMWV